jgi:hypothetical protein
VDLESFFESLFSLTRRQWAVILVLLVCANLIVYGALAGLWVAYVYRQPPLPELPGSLVPTPTLRPTFTPTLPPTVSGTQTPSAVWTPSPTPTPAQ